MPPFCDRHQRYHLQPDECSRMDTAARKLAADKKRATRARQIANKTEWTPWLGITPEQFEQVRVAMAASALLAIEATERAERAKDRPIPMTQFPRKRP